ncbi:MAG: hypothetical protein NC548_36910 [Lachnospiraceae bacterium]|nr:hypothetical protein [Lachnospiraceae bacterium]
MKTINQKAREYAEDYNGSGFANEIVCAYHVGAEEALRSQWRTVEDELPKDGEKCVIMDKDGRVRAAVYDAKRELWRMSGGLFIYPIKTVYCWMSIPNCQGKEGKL